jgi:glycosyltransferase involved in cell wall biosynthesis
VGGGEDLEYFEKRVRTLHMDEFIRFLGTVSHHHVLELISEHDAVVVPSRHEYPEGLPMTIYEAFCCRTPLVASDHPMFKGKVEDSVNALVFRGGEPEHLAECIDRLMSDTALYERLSSNSAAAWKRLQCPVKWGDLLTHWLRDAEEDRRWLAGHSLAHGDYA